MKKPGTAALVTVTSGLIALVGIGGLVIRSSDGGAPPVEVRADGRTSTDGTGPVGTDPTGPPAPTSTSSAATFTSSTTASTRPKATTTTITAPTTTTTSEMACASLAPQYAFGLLRRPDGNGWAAGGNPALQRSTDGGRTWTPVCIQADAVTGPGGLFGIAFAADGVHGWATGGISQQPLALRTVDGGDHWLASFLPADLTGSLGSVTFVDTAHGWTVGSRTGTGPANAAGGYVLATRDGGQTWATQNVPETVARLNRIAFVDATHGWAAGVAGDARPALIGTTDGGASWASQTVPAEVRTLRDVAFVDTHQGWAVGELWAAPGETSPGVVLTTGDGGGTWTQQATTARDLWTLAVVDRQTLFAGGGYGFWASRDGGASWDEQPFALPALDSMSFADAAHGWVTHSMFSVICRTDDGGRTWTPSDVRPGKLPASTCTK